MLLELIYSFGYWSHLEFAQMLSGLELLVVKRAQTGVIITFSKHSKPITHKQLVHPMTPKKIHGRKLDGVSVVVGGDGEYIILDIRYEEIGITEGKRNGMQFVQTEKGFMRNHGYVDEEMRVVAVEEKRSL